MADVHSCEALRGKADNGVVARTPGEFQDLVKFLELVEVRGGNYFSRRTYQDPYGDTVTIKVHDGKFELTGEVTVGTLNKPQDGETFVPVGELPEAWGVGLQKVLSRGRSRISGELLPVSEDIQRLDEEVRKLLENTPNGICGLALQYSNNEEIFLCAGAFVQ